MSDAHITNPHIPEKLMNRIYKHQRFIYDASRKYYLLGRDELIEALKPPIGGTVLELGCGTGRNIVMAAKKYPAAEFFGMDISTEMLKTAGKSIYKANLQKRVSLAVGDATNFDSNVTFAVSGFDRIFISFSLSMIPAWIDVLYNAHTLLKPGGQIHLVDFGDCKDLNPAFKALLYRWLKLFHVHPIKSMENQMAEIANLTNSQFNARSLYASYSIYACFEKPALNYNDQII